MAKKNEIILYIDDNVSAGATDILESPVIANGKTIKVLRFGGLDLNIGDNKGSIIALQWGDGGSWDTIRAHSGGTLEFDINRAFEGNGTKKFRIVRMNKSAQAKLIGAWFEGIIL